MFTPPIPLRPLPIATLSAEQLLAVAVLDRAWADWLSGRGGRVAVAELYELFVVQGGGIWSDLLNLDRGAVRTISTRRAPDRARDLAAVQDPRRFSCRDCGLVVQLQRDVEHRGDMPNVCDACRVARLATWLPSVRADARRIGRVRTSAWPEMADRARWWR